MVWTTRSTNPVYANPWISVDEHQVTGPGGDGIYGVVTMAHPAVFIVALDDADRVCLVDIDRYTVGRSIEIPAGGSDGEDPAIAAARELREETGFSAKVLTQIGQMNALNGIARAPEFVFLATGLEPIPGLSSADQAAEGISAVRWIPLTEVVAMIAAGDITDGESVAAIMFALAHLGRVSA